MNREYYRRKWLRFLGEYEKFGRKVIGSQIRRSALNIPFGDLAKATYVGAITSAIKLSDLEDAYYQHYLSVGIKHGERVGKGINREKQRKLFNPMSFRGSYRDQLRNWMIANNIDSQIITVQRNLIEHLISYIANMVSIGEGFDVVVGRLEKYIRSKTFYAWQIERIVRTETLTAANYGASFAGSVSGIVQVKQWISAKDPRTRRIVNGDNFDHWEMDGIEVGENEPFAVPSRFGGAENMMYPGDPKGSASNRINCRCSVGLIPKRDADGQLIYTGSDASAPAPVLR